MANERVAVFDTTLRDGEQSPGCSMDLAEKVRMARQLEALGVDVIEAGFPIASQGDFEAVKTIAETIKGVTVAGLCRSLTLDIDRAAEALKNAEQKLQEFHKKKGDKKAQHKNIDKDW